MTALDYVVLFGTLLGIAAYGAWRTRGRRNLETYTKGAGNTPWFLIGLSVMATQASAVTFLSLPGQSYESGMAFLQNYFGAPFALLIIAAFFLPIFTKLNVYTAYEFLGKRFDTKTRLLAAFLFLVQRGMQAGITIYAPAIVLSTVMGWPLTLTIVASGFVVTFYTVVGGTDAVTHTQKYQFGVIFLGMVAAFFLLLARMPADVSLPDALFVAGDFNKLQTVDYSFDPAKRYTFWTGIIGGMFLALSYFGADQSQVQRYTSGHSLRESRLGLMFNAIFKIPMQFFILLIGVLVFVFYQFERPPVFFNQTAWRQEAARDRTGRLGGIEQRFETVHREKQALIRRWIAERDAGNAAGAEAARTQALEAHARSETVRAEAKAAMKAVSPRLEKDSDYVFITFILGHFPHGVIGLMLAVFFAATMSSKAGELNALGSATTIDIYKHVVRPGAEESHYVRASKFFTAFWGAVAVGFALFVEMSENMIEAANIVASLLYGVPLALFLVAFFFKKIGGTAIFWAAILAQGVILGLDIYFRFYPEHRFPYLWYNLIAPSICIVLSIVFQLIIGRRTHAGAAPG